MGQSSQSGAAGSSKLPSQQLAHRLPMVTAPDIAAALPTSGAQQLQNKFTLSNVDASNFDSIRMAGDVFGNSANKSTNKYTQQGASYRPPSDTSLTADSQTTTAPTPAPAPAPTPEPPSPTPVASWNPYGKTETDEFVSKLEVRNPGTENQMYSYIDQHGDPVYNDPNVNPNTGRRYRVDYSQSG